MDRAESAKVILEDPKSVDTVVEIIHTVRNMRELESLAFCSLFSELQKVNFCCSISKMSIRICVITKNKNDTNAAYVNEKNICIDC